MPCASERVSDLNKASNRLGNRYISYISLYKVVVIDNVSHWAQTFIRQSVECRFMALFMEQNTNGSRFPWHRHSMCCIIAMFPTEMLFTWYQLSTLVLQAGPGNTLAIWWANIIVIINPMQLSCVDHSITSTSVIGSNCINGFLFLVWFPGFLFYTVESVTLSLWTR